ncbi:ParA family protein [Kaistia dalseonensis]|uniref:Chromosome partitioning protein n=1 Tax=Kaistia dalseonensis TaxID=410840 RepID=A0ABU0H778_9HYPH|nr:ParA family partition ATPase [Kaistia dalseonensis]MCX5495160.1 ParA family protein [Kaistia dalseonensis]MDQ0437743.1 chromosome partitioning protein [Kaistia dalseonensis]
MAGKVLVVSQQKGGSGKTTLTAHLAVALAKGLPVAVLDVDPQGSLGQWFERREQRLGEEDIDLQFRTASGWGAKREARSLARDHAIVVVDTPPRSDLETRHAIEAADLVVVPVQPTPVDLWATTATLELIAKSERDALLVINRALARAGTTDQMLQAIEKLGATVAQTQIGNRVAFATSMGIGGTVLEAAPKSKAALEVLSLSVEILRVIESGGA